MRSWLLPTALLASACGFHPAGDVGAIDAPSDDDGAVAIDAATGDAAARDAAPTDAALIDAALIDARAECPAGYTITSGGARYALRVTPASVTTADSNCTGDLPGRTHLATFENNDLDAVLAGLNTSSLTTVYVGARCDPALDCDVMANWTWLIGGPQVGTGLWQNGEPSADLPFAFADDTDGPWELLSSAGTITRSYLCECDP